MTFRILSFCGGGMCGLMSAMILRRLNDRFETKYGKSLAYQADMIAGTFTGALRFVPVMRIVCPPCGGPNVGESPVTVAVG